MGLALLAWRLAGLRARARLLAGLAFGIGLFVPTLVWVTAFNAIGYGILVLLEAAFFAVACLVVPSGGRGAVGLSGRAWATLPVALAFPGAVVLAEAARSAWPFGGFPMGGIPLGQASGPLLATARVGGPALVTGLAALGGVCLAEAAHLAGRRWRSRAGWRWRSRAGRPARAGRPGVVGGHAVVVVAGAVVVVGAIASSATLAPDGGPALGHIRVAAVQGGGIRGLRAVNVNPDIAYEAQLRASLRVRPPVGLVLWPEDVISLEQPLAASLADLQVAQLARSLGATVIAGVVQTVGKTRFINEAVAWGPNGGIIGTYEKVHRVPFGEYVPGRSILRHFVNLADVPRDAIPGHGPGLLRTPAGPIGVMISYEVFFAGRARAAVRAGGQVLAVPTNTSSYVSDLVPAEEEAADRLRAVEEGRDLVQASPTGYSTVVTNHGRVIARSGLGVPAVVEATLARRTGLTLYERGGDLPVLALAALLIVLGLALAAGQAASSQRGGRA